MIYKDSNRVVVVSNIPSNLIEQAILILKHEPDTENTHNDKKKATKSSGVKQEYILKEAEAIINSYINENKLQDKYPNKVILNKNIIPVNKKLSNTILNVGLIASIALLIFVLSRFL